MSVDGRLRVGIVGLGANTALRHVPGLRACRDVEIVAVCNRRKESTEAAARKFDVPRTFERWQDLVEDPAIDAVVIGTWPYLHCPITVRALAAGKHVLTEARMARDLHEARRMEQARRAHPHLVAQIVPSPLGLRAESYVRERLDDGWIGQLREVVVLGVADAFADPDSPLHWRQQKCYSGKNMLALGILHETLLRWMGDPVSVFAQTQLFTAERRDAERKDVYPVELPDSVVVTTRYAHDAHGLYHLSGAVHFGPGMQIHLYGSEGTLKYHLAPEDRLLAGRRGDETLREVKIPSSGAGGWRVEADFVDAIRLGTPVTRTDFATGVRYMEFTEAVARSAERGQPVALPLP